MIVNQLSRRLRGRSQNGSVAIIVAVFTLFVFIPVMAFVIDLGRWWVVRNELQNAADAAALAGAGYLFHPPITHPSGPPTPNWVLATTEGGSAVRLNRSENVALETGTVTPGYWDFAAKTFDTDTEKTPAPDDLPAVRVVIARTGVQNAGPMLTLLARAFGSHLRSLDASATATAVISYPQAVGPGVLAPIALSECVFSDSVDLWDSETDSPVLNPATGTPWEFVIASGAASGTQCTAGCQCSQWTTFAEKIESAAVVKTAIELGNSVAVDTDTEIYIQSGVEATIYDTAETYLVGKDIIVPVVAPSALPKGSWTPVTRYACLHVDASMKGGGSKDTVCSFFPSSPVAERVALKYGLLENKCLIGHFVPGTCSVGDANGGGGPFNGVYVPPRLVQ